MQGDALPDQSPGHHGPAQSGAGEASSFGQGGDLNGAALRAGQLIDAVGNCRVRNKGLIGGVEEDDGVSGVGPVHPQLKLCSGIGRPGGVVGRAEVHQLRLQIFGRQGKEAVVLPAGDGHNGPSRHQIGIHVGRVGGLDHRHPVFLCEQASDHAQVVPGPVGDEDLRRVQLCAPAGIVVRHSLLHKVLAQLRHIALEALLPGLVLCRPVQGGNHRRGQGQGHVPDAQKQQPFLRMAPAQGVHGLVDAVEQIAGLQAAVIGIDMGHSLISPS